MGRKLSEKTIQKMYKNHVEYLKSTGAEDKDIWTYEEFKDWTINKENSKVAW